MPTDMDMGNKENLKKFYEPFSDAHLEAVIQQVGAGSPEGQTIRQILAERRALPDKQFEKTYNLPVVLLLCVFAYSTARGTSSDRICTQRQYSWANLSYYKDCMKNAISIGKIAFQSEKADVAKWQTQRT